MLVVLQLEGVEVRMLQYCRLKPLKAGAVSTVDWATHGNGISPLQHLSYYSKVYIKDKQTSSV